MPVFFLRHLGGLLLLPLLSHAAEPPQQPASIERGRYLVQIAGCNDCHTAGYAVIPERIPESDWLQGDLVGWSGPWGTTYPSNLRLTMPELDEAQWLQQARNASYRPPMPNRSLHVMSDDDLRSIYRFVNFLGRAGQPAPAYLPPGQQPAGPAIAFPSPPGAN